MINECVMIISGGMDSGVLLQDYAMNGYKIHALTFNYGSNHSTEEIKRAKILASKFAVSHKVIDLPSIKELFKSTLLSGGDTIPEGHYAAENMRSTVVPFRNAIMLSIAVGYAESLDVNLVLLGNHAGDHFIYPDCRPEFISAMKLSAYLGTFKQVQLSSPYCYLTKRDIGLKGNSFNFDFSNTYSCYKGGEKHCGKCGSCTERKEALAGFDKTIYESL